MPTLFVSYSHVEERQKSELEKHLRAAVPDCKLVAFDEREILDSEAWIRAEHFLKAADGMLLLLSPAFLASRHYERYAKLASERQVRGAFVLLVLLKPCTWRVGALERLPAAPRNHIPITQWANRTRPSLKYRRPYALASGELGKRGRLHRTPGEIGKLRCHDQ